MAFLFPPSPNGFGGQQAGNNPVVNMGAADYVFLFETGLGNDGKIHVFKRLSGASTWSVMDDANAPNIDTAPYLPSTGNVQFCCWGDPTLNLTFLLVLKQSGSSPSVTLDGWDVFSFDTSSDTWNGAPLSYANGVGGATLDYLYGNGGGGVDQTSSQAFINVFVRGSADYIFYYSGAPETITATKYGRLHYSTYDGTTFGASVLLPDQAGKSEPFFGVGGVHDLTNGDEHFFYIQLVGHQNLNHVGLHLGSFGTTQVVNAANPDDLYWNGNNIQACESVSLPVVYTNGASTERIAIAGEFYIEPFDGTHQSVFVFTADVAENPTWTPNAVTTGIDGTSPNAPSHSSINLFPVIQGIVGFPQQEISLAVDPASHELNLYWVVTDTTTFLGHVFGAVSTDDGATWTVLGANALDALNLGTNDNAMVEVYAWYQAGGGIGIIGSQLAVGDFSEATQYATTFVPPPEPPACSLNAAPTAIDLPGEPVTLTWTTIGTPTTATIDNGVGAVDPTGGSVIVHPTASVTYTLTVSNENGTSICQASVVVTCASSACALTPALTSNPQPCELGGS